MFKSSGAVISIIVQDSVFLSHIMSGRLCSIFLGSDTGLSHQISKSPDTDRQDPVKGSGWVLFPSTMTEQLIQQMVVGHLCFQERAEQ